MAIVYRTAGDWGAGKGSNLTPAEVDENFYDLHGRVDTLETTPPTPNEITNITQSGSQLTIHMADASTFGPFTIPTAGMRWRGDWLPATSYGINDFFRDADTGDIYLVILAHTSEATFDPDQLSGGDPVYELAVDQVTSRWMGEWLVDTDYVVGDIVNVDGDGVFLVLITHTSDPTAFDPDALSGSDPIYARLSTEAVAGGGGGIAGVVSTSSYGPTATLDQANYLFRCTASGGAINFDIPANSSVAFPLGTMLWIRREGSSAGFTSGTATIVAPSGYKTTAHAINSIIYAIKIDTDTWALGGDLAQDRIWGISGTTLTLALSYYNRDVTYLNFTNAAGCDVTVPPNADHAHPIGAEFHLRQAGAVDVTAVAGSGVTISAKAGSTLSTNGVGAVMILKKYDTNVWHLYGDAI